MRASRVAIHRIGPDIFDTEKAALQYQLGDHLGSSNVVVDGSGDLINREEYRPYGESSFGSFARKRYRFTGKERDEESELYYHGARYYAPRLCRWTAADPAGMVDGPNLYAYVRGNPVRLVDPRGVEGENTAAFPTTVGVAAAPAGWGVTIAVNGARSAAPVIINGARSVAARGSAAAASSAAVVKAATPGILAALAGTDDHRHLDPAYWAI